ncbi:hypothetical protein EV121DRAFT_295759 [Schizophyllum commune]
MLSQRSHKRKTEDTDVDLTLVEGAAAEEKTKLVFTKHERFWLSDGNIMLDTGDIRGLKYCEATIGKWFTKTGRRDEISLTTKFGGCDFSPNATEFYLANNKPDFIRERVETASKRLPTALINLSCQHRRPGWEENAMAAHI